jgi:hypothetical protein
MLPPASSTNAFNIVKNLFGLLGYIIRPYQLGILIQSYLSGHNDHFAAAQVNLRSIVSSLLELIKPMGF